MPIGYFNNRMSYHVLLFIKPPTVNLLTEHKTHCQRMVELSQVSMEMFDDVIGMDKIMNDCPHSAAQLCCLNE